MTCASGTKHQIHIAHISHRIHLTHTHTHHGNLLKQTAIESTVVCVIFDLLVTRVHQPIMVSQQQMTSWSSVGGVESFPALVLPKSNLKPGSLMVELFRELSWEINFTFIAHTHTHTIHFKTLFLYKNWYYRRSGKFMPLIISSMVLSDKN